MRNLTNLQKRLTKLATEHAARGSIQSLRKLHEAVALGCEELGNGVFRTVFKAYDNDGVPVVIKLVNYQNRNSKRFMDSEVYQSNQAEWEAYCNIKENSPELLHMILAPLACWQVGGHCILVYPFVDCVEINEPDRFQALIAMNEDDFANVYADIELCFSDAHWGNIGLHEGRPVLIDYNFGVA
jgi:hypothetical protein